MIVMKFGGASLKNHEAFKRVARIIMARDGRKKLVVVSAWGKTTARLLEAANLAARGEGEMAERFLSALKQDSAELIKGLFGECFIASPYLDDVFNGLKNELGLLRDEKKLSNEARDSILSRGELLTSFILSEYVHSLKFSALWFDVRDVMITDSRFGEADPLPGPPEKKTAELLAPCFSEYDLIITQGFIGKDKQGKTTTLGFEGSDYSALFLAKALKAEEVILWKDVDGVMTGDPYLIPNAKTISYLSYEDMDCLSKLGAKVIHPRAVKPARDNSITIYIKNVRFPHEERTKVGPARNIPGEAALSYMTDLVSLKLTDEERKLEDWLGDHFENPLLLVRQSVYCHFYLPRERVNNDLVVRLEREFGCLSVQPHFSIISVLNSLKNEIDLNLFIKQNDFFHWWSCFTLSHNLLTVITRADELNRGLVKIHDWVVPS